KTSIIKLLLPRGLYCIKNEFLLENRTYALQINEPFKCGGEYGHGGDWIVKINDAQPKISRAGVFEYRYVPFLRKE
ncbi:hypothetical protein M1141_03350, partial [Candidatus Marsarchaeota archaeon]|nr:hypothetical protein [Candidatus Marsarchaeota archaeon]